MVGLLFRLFMVKSGLYSLNDVVNEVINVVFIVYIVKGLQDLIISIIIYQLLGLISLMCY